VENKAYLTQPPFEAHLAVVAALTAHASSDMVQTAGCQTLMTLARYSRTSARAEHSASLSYA